jgi:crotonobetainyl-CoA:carnitine CoA-transferase CaiB-like acyl-CoA transferase
MGPLAGVKIIELSGLGPGPMCAMLLADMGATVLRITRKEPVKLGVPRPLKFDLMFRNRKTIALDLKDPEATKVVLDLIENADALIEGFRPGVTERLGLGPDVCLARNPRLVYGRMTGWGQTGPLAQAAAHDLNYIAVTGMLNAIGAKEKPAVPLTVIGDYAGGGLYLALGLLAAIIETKSSGQGQVVDAAIVDGTVSLATMPLGLRGAGIISEERVDNIVDGGAFFYDVYECADGKFVSVAPVEERFFEVLLDKLEIPKEQMGPHLKRENWDKGRALLTERFKQKTRQQWCDLLEGTDACFAPVLSWDEAPNHPQLRARETFIEVDGVTQPAPAPRFSRTVSAKPVAAQPITPENTDLALADWFDSAQVKALRGAGIID